eukprot:2094125-Alexandrium_andersonii.AAC.1
MGVLPQPTWTITIIIIITIAAIAATINSIITVIVPVIVLVNAIIALVARITIISTTFIKPARSASSFAGAFSSITAPSNMYSVSSSSWPQPSSSSCS